MKPLNPARLQRAVAAAQAGRWRLLGALELLVVRRMADAGELEPYSTTEPLEFAWHPVAVRRVGGHVIIRWESDETWGAIETDADGRLLEDDD